MAIQTLAVFGDVARSRELLMQLTIRDIRIRYKQAVMGFGWAVLLPAVTVGAGLMIRTVAFGASGKTPPPIGGLALKAWAWGFVVGALNFGTASLLSNISIVSKIYFPREVLPIAAVLTQMFDALIGAAVLLAISPWLGWTYSWHMLWAFPLLFLLLALTLGLVLILASANVFFRDVKYILQVFLTFGIFITPVVFDQSMMSARFGRLIMLNPFSGLLEGLDISVARGLSLFEVHTAANGIVDWAPSELILPVVAAVVLLCTGLWLFRAGAAYFAEVH